ncbi:MAG: hypothetical protein IJZ73_02265 [Clostridia bacterium]|nr:hypothetical protein [Clostridia bacterium]
MANFLYCETRKKAKTYPLDSDIVAIAPLFISARGKVNIAIHYLSYYNALLEGKKEDSAQLFLKILIDKIKQVNLLNALFLSHGIDAKRLLNYQHFSDNVKMESINVSRFNKERFAKREVKSALLDAVTLEMDFVLSCAKILPVIKRKEIKETLKQIVQIDCAHAILIGSELEKLSPLIRY